MRGAVINAPGNVEVIDRDTPTIQHPTDAIIKVVAACVCGSDMWPWRGVEQMPHATPIGYRTPSRQEQSADWRRFPSGARLVG